MRENIVRSAAGILALVVAGWTPPAIRAQAPGPESFAQEPKTPVELWKAVDYLVRTGQPAQAVPYIEKFQQSNPDAAALVELRDRFGPGSFLRLSDHPETRKYAGPIVEMLIAATRKAASDPDRIQRLIEVLKLSPEERNFAVSRLRESGPHVVAPLVDAIVRERVATPERSRLVQSAGRLDQSTVPAWIAVLDSPEPHLAADAATVLGMLGDPRAVPFLTYPAAGSDSPAALQAASKTAIERLTGRTFDDQPVSPAKRLVESAAAYARHRFELPSESVLIWKWDDQRRGPVATKAAPTDVEEYFGLKLAEQALRLDPDNREARATRMGLVLEKAIERVGFDKFPAADQATFAEALAEGPTVLAGVLSEAVAQNKTDLAAVAADALGKVTPVDRLAADGRPHPLVDALSTPGRRLQLAAARAIVDMAPTEAFPGSSRVAPALARFVMNQGQAHAVVIDGNPTRGAATSGMLEQLGYESMLSLTGEKGFQTATEAADVELILVSYSLTQGRWDLLDVLSSLRGDARTANLPLFIYGPQKLEITRRNLPVEYPGVRFLIQTDDVKELERQLGGRPSKLTDAERIDQARQAAALLARIAARPKGPLASGLASIEPALTVAIANPAAALDASAVLGDVPNPDAQRALADAALDPSHDPALRRSSAEQLARSIQRFGPMVAADQEVKLLNAFKTEPDAETRATLGMVVGSLRSDRRLGVKAPSPAH